MAQIEFISHESFPEDQYIKELVYLSLDGKTRLAYVRKKIPSGALFWSAMTLGIMKDGMKEYFEAFCHDSFFLQKDIKNFLESRSWEKNDISQEQQPFQGMPF